MVFNLERQILISSILVVSAGMSSCSQKKQEPLERKKAKIEGRSSDGGDDAQDGDSGKAYLSLDLYDPSSAEVTLVNEKPIETEASEDSRLSVPLVKVKRKNSDIVQALRCPVDYEATTVLGEDVKNETVHDIGEDRLRRWWNDAIAVHSGCKLIGNHITREKIVDISARTGSWFYVINPCVSQKRSKTQTAGCSYRLKVSKPIKDYENLSQEDFYEKAGELAEIEGQIAASVETLIYNAKEMPMAVRFCEDKAIIKDIERRTGEGFKKLGSMVVGATVGAIMSGGVGAIQGASLALKYAGAVFKEEPPQSEGCPKADKLYKDSELAYESLDILAEQVQTIREEMAELNSDYSGLNSTIRSDYISSPSNSYNGVPTNGATPEEEGDGGDGT